MDAAHNNQVGQQRKRVAEGQDDRLTGVVYFRRGE
jgi:hypothetical protein